MKKTIFVVIVLLLVGCTSQENIKESNQMYYKEREIIINACIAQGGVPDTASSWTNRIVCRWKGEKK